MVRKFQTEESKSRNPFSQGTSAVLLTAGQQVGRSILHLGHDSNPNVISLTKVFTVQTGLTIQNRC